MRWRKTRRPKEFDADTDTLNRLLDGERNTASRLEAARVEADRLLQEAREYAIKAEAACQTTVNEQVASLAAAEEAELQRELQRIQSDAALEAARFNDPDSSRTRALVARLLEAIGATSPTTEAAR